MTPTELNKEIDRHFRSNGGSHRCVELHGKFAYMVIGEYKGRPIPSRVAHFILRTYPEIHFVVYSGSVYTKDTLRRAGFSFKEDKE